MTSFAATLPRVPSDRHQKMSIQFGDPASQRASRRARNKSTRPLEKRPKNRHAIMFFQQVRRPILTDTSNTKHVHTSDEDSLVAYAYIHICVF